MLYFSEWLSPRLDSLYSGGLTLNAVLCINTHTAGVHVRQGGGLDDFPLTIRLCFYQTCTVLIKRTLSPFNERCARVLSLSLSGTWYGSREWLTNVWCFLSFHCRFITFQSHQELLAILLITNQPIYSRVFGEEQRKFVTRSSPTKVSGHACSWTPG